MLMAIDKAQPNWSEVVAAALAEAEREDKRQFWRKRAAAAAMRRWYLLSVLPQLENRISGHLVGMKVSNVYSPQIYVDRLTYSRQMLTGKRICTGRKRVLEPMLRGYLFVRLDYDAEWPRIRARIPAEQMQMVNRPDGNPYVVHDVFMQAVFETELELGEKKAEKARFEPGQAIRLLTGPFQDWLGRVERLEDGDRIRVLLDLFGRETPVVQSSSEIEAVKD
jgi:transcriptional antiterminator NusG